MAHRSLGSFALFAAALTVPAVAQEKNPAVHPALEGQVSHLAPESLYQGWRSGQFIGQKVLRKTGDQIGTARDLIISNDGHLSALLVAGGGALGIPDAVYRISWNEVDLTPGHDGLTIDLSDGKRPEYALFPGTEGVTTLPQEFRLTEVIGDYARLQTGYGYGYVTDAVFRDGRLIAVLVSRDAASGGGTFAFAFPRTIGRWDPGASYYGLPFVTVPQAQSAALRIDPKRFSENAL